MAIPAKPLILSFEDARRCVEAKASDVRIAKTEKIDLLSAGGRILATSIVADRDFPPFPRSTRDGFAVRAIDVAKVPATLKNMGEVRAGENPDKFARALQSGETISIMTGAPVPDGADAVVMVEFTKQSGDRIEIGKAVIGGENIVPRGAEAKQGAVLVERGARLREASIALAASAGCAALQVFAKPKVAVLATGDEVVDIDATPDAFQIRNSNTYSLATQIAASGGEPLLLPIAPDEPNRLQQLIKQGLTADLLLITGGVSVGRYDLVEQVLTELGAEFFFTGALIQPGRPVVFGKVSNTFFFGLPGNPVSTMVTFELFVKPIFHALAGRPPTPLKFLHARLKNEVKTKTGLKRFLPALLTGEFESSTVEVIPWQGSGDIAATAQANCFLVVPPDREHIAAGESVAVMLPGAEL